MPEWSEASTELIHIGEDLIEERHKHLRAARIGFVFRKDDQHSGGRFIAGGVSKVSPKEQVFVDLDYIIWISEETWNSYSSERREALVDHQLCHCGFGSNGWVIVPHDVEEFTANIARYGYRNSDLIRMDNAAHIEHPKQMAMVLGDTIRKTGCVKAIEVSVMEKAEAVS